jgi:YHS domain-containing protein
MTIDESAVGNAAYEGRTYHFCGGACQQQFEADPGQYA